jgi:hypothetical protein
MINDDLIKKVTGQYDLSLVQRLNLDNFGLKSLGNLVRMESLCDASLSRNDITDISPLANLTELRRLNLSDNMLRNLSPLVEEGPGLDKLAVLDLSGNHRFESLEKVIETLKRLPSLRNLTLKSSNEKGSPVTEYQQDLANPNKYPRLIFEELPDVTILDGSHVMIMKASMGESASAESGSSKENGSIGEEKEGQQQEIYSWVDLSTLDADGEIIDYSPRKNAVLGAIEDKQRDSIELIRKADASIAAGIGGV